jgi:hypothetical protein
MRLQFKWFKKKEVPTSKVKDLPKLDFAFTINGENFYTYNDEFKYPLDRFIRINQKTAEFHQSLERGELLGYYEEISKLSLEVIQAKGMPDKNKIAQKIGYISEQLKYIQTNLYTSKTIWELIALRYISENESMDLVDDAYTKAKMERLIEASKQLQYQDFFYQTACKVHLPFADITIEQFRDYMTVSEMHLQAVKEILPTL